MILINGQPLPVTIFPDNTSQVWKLPENFLNTRFVNVEWQFSHEGEFMHLAQLKDLLDAHGVIANLKLTYLPYGRQDKHVGNNATFALHTFATLLNSLEFHEVVIVDPHSEVALGLIDYSRAEYLQSLVAEISEKNNIDLFCYPDKGALAKYESLFIFPHIYGEKVRDQTTGNILSYKLVGDPQGKNVLIVDDICDGGMTFKILAKDLLAKGAKSVVLYVTHGIYSKGVRTLYDSGIEAVYDKDGHKGPRFGSNQI